MKPLNFSAISPCKPYLLNEEHTHIWGIYKSLQISESHMARIIKFYNKGKTSLHKHQVNEILLVEMGALEIKCGESPNKLTTYILGTNQMILLPAGLWHITSCKKKISKKYPYALAVEFISGNIQDGDYQIERYIPAKKSPYKPPGETLEK